MNKNLLLFFFLSFFCRLFAQTAFPFEAVTVPTQWVATTGNLSISAEHYKQGVKSLCWKTTGQSVLTITPTAFATSTSNCVYFQLHSPVITGDKLKVDFFNGTTLVRSMELCINYRGWREICRAYTEFVSTASVSITKIQMTLIPVNNTTLRTLYFDDVKLNTKTPTSRHAETQWINDCSYFSNKVETNGLTAYSLPIDIAVTTPTAAELSGLSTIKSINKLKVSPKVGKDTELAEATTYAQSLNIVRNSDGSVRGDSVALRCTDLSESLMLTLTRHLEVLAAGGASTATLFNNLLDHLQDQGFAEGIEYSQGFSSYDVARTLPEQLLNILPSCNAVQKEEVVKLCKWIMRYNNNLYQPSDTYLSNLNSDNVYIACPFYIKTALNQPTDALCVRELKAFKRYLDRNGEYVPGELGFLKSDGTGFHHKSHYINYMYAYKEFTEYMSYLKGTVFKVEAITYEHLKKAVLSQYKMGNLSSTDGNHNIGFSLCGRKPFSLKINYAREELENLVSVGLDLYGVQDNEIAGAYNYFYKSTKYVVPVPGDYSGFHTFNYSPVSIYRQSNWVASMRAPTSQFWGAEIYPDENRFGRYQSHGTLEVIYDGLQNSGYPGGWKPHCGGWDWNVVPGATTVHYTNWVEMMPNKDVSERLDQYSTKNFSGGLSWGDMGIFACDFVQSDSWGKQKFTPTKLKFKKTVLGVDNMLIDIGTNISAVGIAPNTGNTATNLFQSIIITGKNILQINGSSISSAYNNTLAANTAHTILSPVGTGYIVPQGNDAINVIYGDQTSPKHDGSDVASPTTTLKAAKAYLVHGLTPANKNYQFVVLPSATPQTLTALATSVNQGSIYRLLHADSTMHVLHYLPRNIMAYTFFRSVVNVKDSAFHIVKGITTEALLLERKSSIFSNTYDFAIANPNMRYIADTTYGWLPTPTVTVLTLAGKWVIKTGSEGVVLLSATDDDTQIQVTLKEGEPQYFSIQNPANSVSAPVDKISDNTPVLISDKKNDRLSILFKDFKLSEVELTIVYPDGRSSVTKKYQVNSGIVNIDHPALQTGLNIIKINAAGVRYVLKTID